ncbi:Cinnamoyl-CoA reductase 2 [Cinnamomum micranthum f. kanehirae]|uniref:Cinnamoyl-CoA reductase 2 n=1 Tax=Cinnamomum micranthum f. kanehirae TaxID=337451 RepID=A0A443N2J2_9MAGN|nr:Cinnamoyl-CoA reductase 2 [Cinnamomum micranthum f. kanehirae]
MEGERGRVCVTGAGGFIGSWVVKLLLSEGYMVHGTVREPDDEKNAHLKILDKAKENLQLFKANLLDYDSLLSAIKGCNGVFHVASPVLGNIELIEPAVTGTLNVLKACSVMSIKRVVVVSSIGAVHMNPNWPKDKVMDEDCWSDKEYCKISEEAFNWYSLSKTMAESEALEYAKKNTLEVVTVCPSWVMGPMLQPSINSSSTFLILLLQGKFETIENKNYVLVDVRDVAEALLLVYEKQEASGRYICGAHHFRYRDLIHKLQAMYPNYNYPKNFVEVDEELKLSSEKLMRLGWKYRSLEETLVDTVEYIEETGSVCVTGAGGYLASWLVKLLLSKGYKVHGTVREPDDEKNAHLKKLERAEENLQLFKANLLDYGFLSAAITGCSGVFHVASPVPSGSGLLLLAVDEALTYNYTNAQRIFCGGFFGPASHVTILQVELIEPAVTGTVNVLKACSEAGVKRVVVVSSGAAVAMNPNWPKDKVIDEDCWSDEQYCKTTENWYCASKTIAEREALQYADKNNLDVITVCPALILGPLLQSTANTSSLFLVKLLKGGLETTENKTRAIVDVRDVAEALLLTYEKPEASRRYICASHIIQIRDLVGKLRSMYPNYKYPKNFTDVDGNGNMNMSSEKLKRLGWQCRPLEETLRERGREKKNGRERECMRDGCRRVSSIMASEASPLEGIQDSVNLSDDEKNAHLKKLERAEENLQLFKANLLDYGSLSAAITGCSGVFHVASPVDLIEPAVTGTVNVLKACSEAGVKRVVVVSSGAAILMNPNWPKDKVMDEDCWSDEQYCKTTENWYCASKTIAERAALQYADKNNLDVITVCPTQILGPLLQSTANASSLFLVKLLKGGLETMENKTRVIVDVRDVAEALLLTYEKPEASGRYICAPHIIQIRDLVGKLRSMHPNYKYPKNFTDSAGDVKISSEKLKRLGWQCRPLEETLVNTRERGREKKDGRERECMRDGCRRVSSIMASEASPLEGIQDDEKNAHLKKLERAEENLQLFKANLLDYGSLSAAITGCSGVFHVASPVPSGTLTYNYTYAQRIFCGGFLGPASHITILQVDLIEPAVTGTVNVLKACSEAGVKRVVVVSSGAAILMNPNWPKDKVMDEDCWSDEQYCKTTEQKGRLCSIWIKNNLDVINSLPNPNTWSSAAIHCKRKQLIFGQATERRVRNNGKQNAGELLMCEML